MVRFSEIQQFPDFLERFPGNSRTSCIRFENFGIFGGMESARVSSVKLSMWLRAVVSLANQIIWTILAIVIGLF